jgi:hypothetical protein
MATLSIPKRQYGILRKLSELSDAQFDELLSGLQSIQASLNPFDFAKNLSEKTKSIPPGDIKNFVGMLCSLYPAKENYKKTANEIAHDIREKLEEEKPAHFSLVNIPTVESRLVKLLDIDKAMAVTAKAYDIITDQAKIFGAAKILSDIRPIFSASADEVSAATVIHTLNISYHEEGEHREFFISLDNSDIRSLRATLDRADKKAKILTTMIQKSGINYLEVGE